MKRTPIDPADIRVGDLVERRCTYPDGTKTRHRGVVLDANNACFDLGKFHCFTAASEVPTDWYLIERPDPDKALIEAMAQAGQHADMPDSPWDEIGDGTRTVWLYIAGAVLAAIRETHDVTPRAEQ